jgi:hypothetical protein
MACISAAEESLAPYIITSQDMSSLREQLNKHGTRFRTDFILKSRAKLYINAENFAEYIRTVFLPTVNELPTLGEFANEEPMLLVDNCWSHFPEAVLAFFEMHRGM